jgi:TPR repeat protein
LLGTSRAVKRNAADSFENFKEAAQAGVVNAQETLARMYEAGTGGAPQDYAEALKLYTLASASGSDVSDVALGRLYNEGLGVRKSSKKAFSYFQRAAEKGNAAAEYYLGEMLLEGDGCKKDTTLAVDYIRKSAGK